MNCKINVGIFFLLLNLVVPFSYSMDMFDSDSEEDFYGMNSSNSEGLSNNSETDNDEFAQEKLFHQRLISARPGLDDSRVNAYYKKITPITSNPNEENDQWAVASVSVSDNNITPNNGTYTSNGISFQINNLENIDPTRGIFIDVAHAGESKKIQLTLFKERSVPALPGFSRYNDLLRLIRNNRLSLRYYVTLRGRLRIPGEKSCSISIELTNQSRQPITLRGMQVVCNKSNHKTNIFFDFTDSSNKPIDYFNPIICDHSESACGNNILCIKNHRAYNCAGKKIYGLFDSNTTRGQWISNINDFYDQNNNRLTTLPTKYLDPDDHQETLKESVVWVLGDGYNSLYRLDGTENLKDSNEYIYRENGRFFLTLPYTARYRDHFSNNTTLELDYLVKVAKPHMTLDQSEIVENGHCDWSNGVYERIYSGNKVLWKKLDPSKRDVIKFDKNKVKLLVQFNSRALNRQQNKQWCEAAQRFLLSFPAKISTCDPDIINGLSRWNKLTHLNLSRLNLRNVEWETVFEAISEMQQLTHLNVAYNHPVKKFFSKNGKNALYKTLANSATEYYRAIAVCLGRLRQLKELHMQGLWLKPYRELGSGCNSTWGVSTEVARLTGIINHREQAGIRSIIRNICRLKQLEKLSLDGIPNHGSSDFKRMTSGQKVGLCLLTAIGSYFQYKDGKNQDRDMKQLVIDSTSRIAHEMTSLETVNVYSPGGNCVDYFSDEFKRLLPISRTISGLPTLKVFAKVLQ